MLLKMTAVNIVGSSTCLDSDARSVEPRPAATQGSASFESEPSLVEAAQKIARLLDPGDIATSNPGPDLCPALSFFAELTDDWAGSQKRQQLLPFAERIAASRDNPDDRQEVFFRTRQIVDWALLEIAPLALAARGRVDLAEAIVKLGSVGPAAALGPEELQLIARKVTASATAARAEGDGLSYRLLTRTSSAVNTLGSALGIERNQQKSLASAPAAESVRRAYIGYAIENSHRAAQNADLALCKPGEPVLLQLRFDILERICPILKPASSN